MKLTTQRDECTLNVIFLKKHLWRPGEGRVLFRGLTSLTPRPHKRNRSLTVSHLINSRLRDSCVNPDDSGLQL